MLPFVEVRLQGTQTLPSMVLFTENPFWYQQFDLRQIRILRRGQSIVDFETVDSFRLYVSTMKAMNFQDEFPSIPNWSLCAGVWFDFNARRYWKLSLSWSCWRTTKTGAKSYPSSWKRYWTHCIGWTIVIGCSWQVWFNWKECVKMDNFAVQQISNRILLLKLQYLGSFPSENVPTLDLLTRTLLLISTHNPAICKVNIGSLLQNSVMNCILQTLLDVKVTVFSAKTTSNTSRWCQHPYSLTQVCAAFIQYMQLFISSSFNSKKNFRGSPC